MPMLTLFFFFFFSIRWNGHFPVLHEGCVMLTSLMNFTRLVRENHTNCGSKPACWNWILESCPWRNDCWSIASLENSLTITNMNHTQFPPCPATNYGEWVTWSRSDAFPTFKTNDPTSLESKVRPIEQFNGKTPHLKSILQPPPVERRPRSIHN